MQRIKGIFLNRENNSASPIEFDDAEGRPAELLGCFFTGAVKRRVGFRRYLFTFNEYAQDEKDRILTYDDRMDGIYGDALITEFDREGKMVSIEPGRLQGLLEFLKKDQGKVLGEEIII